VRKFTITFWLIFIVIVGCSCDNKKDPGLIGPSSLEIQKSNAVRRELGIREIKDTWRFYYRKVTEETWNNGAYQCKKVAYWDNSYSKTKWEEDYYYTGKTFLSIPGDPGERISRELFYVHYGYGDKTFSINYMGLNASILTMLQKLESTTWGNRDEGDYEYGKDYSTADDVEWNAESLGQITPGYRAESNSEPLKLADQILCLLGCSRL